MFNSRIHFRTNTFDILSHLADRETTDARYIHARLLTYFPNFNLRHLSPTYMICHEREAVVRRNEHFKIISYTKQSNYTIYYFLNKCFDQCQSSVMASRWSIYTCSTIENKFFYLCCRKIFLEFSNICPNRGRCI